MGRINLCGLFNTALELFKVYALFWGDVARVELLKKLCVKKGSEIFKAARVFT